MTIAVVSYLYVSCFILAWLADSLPFFNIIKSISLLSIASIQIIRAETIDDTTKEKTILGNSFIIFKQSLIMLALIIFIAVSGFLLLYFSKFIKPLNFTVLLDYVNTLSGISISMMSFLSYFLLKKLYVKVKL